MKRFLIFIIVTVLMVTPSFASPEAAPAQGYLAKSYQWAKENVEENKVFVGILVFWVVSFTTLILIAQRLEKRRDTAFKDAYKSHGPDDAAGRDVGAPAAVTPAAIAPVAIALLAAAAAEVEAEARKEGQLGAEFLRAVEAGFPHTVKRLIAEGADVETPNILGMPPLMVAAGRGDPDIVTLLVKAKANVDATWYRDGLNALLYAAQNGNAKALRVLLNVIGIDVEATDNYGDNALMIAASRGHAKVLTLLMEAGADANAANEKTGTTALMHAARNGQHQAVSLLLRSGAKSEAKDKAGMTAVLHAAMSGHTEVLEALRAGGVDILAIGPSGTTAAMLAAEKGHAQALQFLLDAGAPINLKRKGAGFTALMFAAISGQADAIRVLHAAPGIDVNARDNEGRTALMWAAHNGHTKAVIALLAFDGIEIDAEDHEGDSALRMAALLRRTASANVLVASGAALNVEGEDREVALKAFEEYAKTLKDVLSEDLTILGTLPPNARRIIADMIGGVKAPSLALLAALIGDADTLETMAKTKDGRARLAVRDAATQMTPLSAAISAGQHGAGFVLLHAHDTHRNVDLVNPRRIHPFARRTNTQTPLMAAAKIANLALVRQLLRAGAHPLDSFRGKTAAQLTNDETIRSVIRAAEAFDFANHNSLAIWVRATGFVPTDRGARALQLLIYKEYKLLLSVKFLNSFLAVMREQPFESQVDALISSLAYSNERVMLDLNLRCKADSFLAPQRLALRAFQAYVRDLRVHMRSKPKLASVRQALADFSDLHDADKAFLDVLVRYLALRNGDTTVELSADEVERVEFFFQQPSSA